MVTEARDPTMVELQDLIGFDDVARILGVQVPTARRYTYGYRPGFPEAAIKPPRTLYRRRDIEKHYGLPTTSPTDDKLDDELLGYTDIAQLIGRSKKTISVHAHITTDFPTPVVLARQPLFRKHDITRYAATLNTPQPSRAERSSARPINVTVHLHSDDRPTAAATAGQIHLALAVRDHDLALQHFMRLNTALRRAHGRARAAIATDTPASTRSRRWDSAIAGLVAFRLNEESLDRPDWLGDRSRVLARSWSLGGGPAHAAVEIERVPSEFLQRRVLVDPAMLAAD